MTTRAARESWFVFRALLHQGTRGWQARVDSSAGAGHPSTTRSLQPSLGVVARRQGADRIPFEECAGTNCKSGQKDQRLRRLLQISEQEAILSERQATRFRSHTALTGRSVFVRLLPLTSLKSSSALVQDCDLGSRHDEVPVVGAPASLQILSRRPSWRARSI